MTLLIFNYSTFTKTICTACSCCSLYTCWVWYAFLVERKRSVLSMRHIQSLHIVMYMCIILFIGTLFVSVQLLVPFSSKACAVDCKNEYVRISEKQKAEKSTYIYMYVGTYIAYTHISCGRWE